MMSHMDARTGLYRYVATELYETMPFYIEMAGFDRCAPQYYLKRTVSPLSVAGITLKGSGCVIQNGKIVEATVGSLFLVNEGDTHAYYPTSDWEFCWVNIRGAYWRTILARYGLETEILFPDVSLGQTFIDTVQAVVTNKTDLDAWQFEMQSFLLKLVLHLHRTHRMEQEQSLGTKLKMEFQRHRNDGLSQDAICRQLGITPRHAQRVFKQEFGMSIHQFLSQSRLQQAKELLIHTNGSIKQIAIEIGFENEKYFSTFFHQHEGITPTQYRKQNGYVRENR